MAVAQVTRYVREGASGAGTGESWDDAYPTLIDAIADVNADFPNFAAYDSNADGIADGVAVTLLCRGSVGHVDINCAGTTESCFIKIKGDGYLSGAWSSTAPTMTTGTTSRTVDVLTGACIIEDMQIGSTYGGSSSAYLVAWHNSADNVGNPYKFLRVERCILRGSANKTGHYGIRTYDNQATGKKLQVVNCVIGGNNFRYTLHLRLRTNDTFVIYNNTLVGGSAQDYVGESYGGNDTGQTLRFLNNALKGSTGGWRDLGGIATEVANYSAYPGTTGWNPPPGPGANSQVGLVEFVDEANFNFMLASTDTVARGNGYDLSADVSYPFNTDIQGETRDTTWEIGADAHVAGVAFSAAAALAKLTMPGGYPGFEPDMGGFMETNPGPNGEPVSYTIQAQPANGDLRAYVGGAFEYIPALDFSGEDSFTYYTYFDGQQSSLGTITILVEDAYVESPTQGRLGVKGLQPILDTSNKWQSSQGNVYVYGGVASLPQDVVGSGQGTIGIAGQVPAGMILGWRPTAKQGLVEFINVSEERLIANEGSLGYSAGGYPVLDINANGGIENGPGPSDEGDQLDAEPVTVHLWVERETTVKLRR